MCTACIVCMCTACIVCMCSVAMCVCVGGGLHLPDKQAFSWQMTVVLYACVLHVLCACVVYVCVYITATCTHSYMYMQYPVVPGQEISPHPLPTTSILYILWSWYPVSGKCTVVRNIPPPPTHTHTKVYRYIVLQSSVRKMLACQEYRDPPPPHTH